MMYEYPDTIVATTSSWIKDGKIIISEIPTVPGSVVNFSEFSITTTNNWRRLKGNGLPNHPIGVYPIENASVAYSIYSMEPAQGEDNAAEIPVSEYYLDIIVPKNPVLAPKPSCVESIVIGVASQTGAVWHMEYAVNNDAQVCVVSRLGL